MDLEKILITYFRENHDIGVDSYTALIKGGIIDSIGVVELVTFINENIGVEFETEDMTMENFKNVSTICALIRLKKDGVNQ